MSKRGLVYTIKEVDFKGDKVINISKFKTVFGVKKMLSELIQRDLTYGVRKEEIVVYNYTRKNLEIEGIKYYPLTNRFLKHFDRQKGR